MNTIKGVESKKQGSLSIITKKDGHFMGMVNAYLFSRVGEEVLLNQDGKWYRLGYVESMNSVTAMIRFDPL